MGIVVEVEEEAGDYEAWKEPDTTYREHGIQDSGGEARSAGKEQLNVSQSLARTRTCWRATKGIPPDLRVNERYKYLHCSRIPYRGDLVLGGFRQGGSSAL